MSKSTSSESSVVGGWVITFLAHGISVSVVASVSDPEPCTGPGGTTDPAVRNIAIAKMTTAKSCFLHSKKV
jgi:hypothetical protein